MSSTFKVRIPVALDVLHRSWITGLAAHIGKTPIDLVNDALVHARLDMLDKARSRIAAQLQRDPYHLDMLYLSWDGTSDQAVACYTFNDRTTALMFRLSED